MGPKLLVQGHSNSGGSSIRASRVPQVWALPSPAEDAEEILTPAFLSWLSLQERLPDGY